VNHQEYFWASNEEEDKAAQALFDQQIDTFLENYIESTIEEPLDPVIERAVEILLNPTITNEHSKLTPITTLSSLT
jgi:hypothetical protein